MKTAELAPVPHSLLVLGAKGERLVSFNRNFRFELSLRPRA